MENQLVIFEDRDKKIEVQLKEETIWLNLNQIAYLFDVQKAAISKHIKNIFDSKELEPNSTVSKMETVQIEGKREVKRKITYYNLDVIIAVGYRVNSKKATQFRIWATNVLKNYLVKGYAVNEKKLTQEKLKELATVLFKKVRENTSIDWAIRESARAKLKVIIKRTLRQFGYPPDMQKLATQTVLKQAEALAHELIERK